MQANVKAAVFSDEAERVDALVRLAHEYGGAALRAEVGFIVEGATSKRAAVAVLGQFKRGKSMLVNALLGNNILPIGKLPLTGVPTRVLYGEPALGACRGFAAEIMVELRHERTLCFERP
ncbi:MAG: dynamin family protein [Candidatus Eremiobacteraeota bacterium]|nr:dynamin family protein [Candidatus Eremiobacteraeota bacterium]